MPSKIAATIAAFISVTLPAAAEDRLSIFQFDKNADLLEVRMGVLSYDTGIYSTKEHDGAVINAEVLFASPTFLERIGSPRPYLGVDFAPDPDQVDFLYAGLNWEAYFTERLYLSMSLGGSLNNAEDVHAGVDALGCRALFHLGGGLGFDLSRKLTLQLYADHFSNANVCPENAGAEAAGIRFGYRF